jgi:transposase InsO family protein
MIKYKGRIVIGSTGLLREDLIKSIHDSYIGGHVGIQNTYRRLKAHFYWPSMKKLIQRIVLQCDICKQAKAERVVYPGLLQPLPIPRGTWQDVIMDFVEGLPRSEGRDTIMVIVDRFTKYEHFIALAHPFTAQDVAKLFLDHIYKFHGLPVRILTNRDKIFTSLFWRELFKHLGLKLLLNTLYHPQTDGKTERVNQCLETYLHCITMHYPKKWN